MPEHALLDPEMLSPVSSRRNQLLDALGQHIFNDLPAHLIRISDMKLVSRQDLWEDTHASIQNLSSGDLLALRSPQEDVQARIKYAIFSHRWGAHEPSYQQLSRDRRWWSSDDDDDDEPGVPAPTSPSPFLSSPTTTPTSIPTPTSITAPATSRTRSPGIKKLLRFCDKARAHGCAYAWSDTCCIDKSSSAELEEAIRTMYRWYRDAEICIVHLAATDTLADFDREPWFRRGWTLQELLAPKRITFYTKDWVPISGSSSVASSFFCSSSSSSSPSPGKHKQDWRVLGAVSRVTGIPAGDLRHFLPGCDRVSEKMRWASRRQTTRIEDVAYALIGIFDVGTMSISYGEGRWAFHRLMESIAARCTEPGFFAWAGDPSPYSLALPSSPASYGAPVLDGPKTAAGLRLTGSVFEEVGDRSYSITKLGLQVKLLLLPVRWIRSEQRSGCYTLSFPEGRFLETNPCPTLSQAYYEIFKPEQCVLGVVNYARVEGDRGTLRAGERYFCLLLKRRGRSGYIRAQTDKVLVWECVEGITKDVEDVCLLNTLGSYDRDIAA